MLIISSTKMHEKISPSSAPLPKQEGKVAQMGPNHQNQPQGDNPSTTETQPRTHINERNSKEVEKTEKIEKGPLVWKEDKNYGFDFAVYSQATKEGHSHSLALAKIIKMGQTMGEV